MKNVNLYMYALAVLLLFWGCDKGPDLTPMTQEGKNTFSCKVNGKVWIPEGRSDIFVSIKPIYGGFTELSSNKPLAIRIQTYGEGKKQMDIFLRTVEGGIHELKESTNILGMNFYPENYGWYQNVDGISFITGPNKTGLVTIARADTISDVISGSFEFEGGNSLGQTVKVTDGRFDIKSPLL